MLHILRYAQLRLPGKKNRVVLLQHRRGRANREACGNGDTGSDGNTVHLRYIYFSNYKSSFQMFGYLLPMPRVKIYFLVNSKLLQNT